MGVRGDVLSRSMYKGHMDKDKEGRIKGGSWGLLGLVGGVLGGK